MNAFKKLILIFAVLVVLAGALSLIPPIHERLVYHVDLWRADIAYALYPPEKEVFVPKANPVVITVKETATPPAPTQPPAASPTPTEIAASPTPAPTDPPLPDKVAITGVRYTDQHNGWNNCGPANLSMALSFWGRKDTILDTAAYLKPFDEDKNVMPYEMASYVTDKTDLGVALRYGGTPEVVKKLLANNYPVLLEIGTYRIRDSTGKLSWMGHYQTVTGYDNTTQKWIIQDSYFPNGQNLHVDYATIASEWRSFNFVFLVVYPKDQEAKVMGLLGNYADETNSEKIAYKTASDEVYSLQGVDQLFAWYNRGSSLVLLQDYNGAATAYDEAFKLMAQASDDKRPYRLAWYETGPYFAYYFTGRYQDVINLAKTVLDPLERTGKPYLEESYFWRGRAEYATGDLQNGTADVRTALQYHPGFQPAIDQLTQWGVSP